MNMKKELNVAKKAALTAGEMLLNQKDTLNNSIFSSDRDIKLEADLAAENIIKNIKFHPVETIYEVIDLVFI